MKSRILLLLFKPISILLVFIVLFICSCTAPMEMLYIPNSNNVPLLKEKDEFKGTIMPANFQTAFSFTNHIGFMVNGEDNNWLSALEQDHSTITSDHRYDEHWRCKLIEAGAGYFTSQNQNEVYEIYGGTGYGEMTTTGNLYLNADVKMNYYKTFIQPAIGFSNDYLDFAFSLRTSYVYFFNYTHTGLTSSNSILDTSISSFQPHQYNSYLFEPAFTLKVGHKYVKFHTQLGLSIPTTRISDNQRSEHLTVNYWGFNANLGITVNIASRFKSQKL